MAKSPTRPMPRILLVLSAGWAFDRQVVRGITEYADEHGPWEFHFDGRDRPLDQLLQANPDAVGIIARPTTREDHARLAGLRVPVVITHDEESVLPRVGPDDEAVGRLAADHFAGKGYRHVAYCGVPEAIFSQQRQHGLEAGAQQHSMQAHVYTQSVYPGIAALPDALAPFLAWLGALPRPVGLLAAEAQLAREVISCCRRAGRVVPHEIAVLGVDNDPLACELSVPKLSVVDHGAWRIGYASASLLDSLLAGARPPTTPTIIKPVGVVERESTDTLAVEDPDVAAALQYIRQHFGAAIGVGDVLRHVPVARRWLERAFARTLGRTIHDEIMQARISTARHLLARTDMALARISAQCGFRYPTKFSAAFRQLVRQTPRAYRQEFRTR